MFASDMRGVVCAQHLSQINNGLQHYALSNQHYFPRVVYDAEHNPNGWTSFTGADCDDPFAEGASVRPNDVTASVWLLVRTEATPTAAFICPSTADMPDALLDAAGTGWMRAAGVTSGAFATFPIRMRSRSHRR